MGPAIGIDLGTTYSCVAYWKNDRVDIIANDQGNRTTPSYVAFTNNERFIGDAAYNQAAFNPSNTIFDAKRLIGRKFSDKAVQNDMKLWPFKVICGSNDRPMISVTYKGEEKQFAAEEISSMVLVRMKQIAEDYIGSEVKDAVITVPAYFDQMQRQATIDAGAIAGINVLRIINEPTAAAIAYGHDNNVAACGKSNVLIFDLGGGTFDVSVLTIQEGSIQVKAIAGDTHLGGEDFDNRVVNHFIEKFKSKHNLDIAENPKAMRKLRTACEKGKRMLTFQTEARIEVDALFQGIDFSAVLTRSKFDDLNVDLFDKCMELVEKCLTDAEMSKNDIDDVVLIGGSSRIVKVQQMIYDLLNGKEIRRRINPDEAVAHGAAIQAAIMSGEGNVNVPNIVLVEVTPLSLGIKMNSGMMSVVIPKYTMIPTTREVLGYTTTKDNQTGVSFKVYEGESARARRNKLLGRFSLKGIQLAPKGVPKLDVRFDLQASGILHVSARDRITGQESSITIKSERLSEQQIERMKEEANKYKAEDEMIRRKNEARRAFEVYVRLLRDEIKVQSNDMNHNEKKMAEDAIEEALDWLDSSEQLAEVHEYEERKEKLKSLFCWMAKYPVASAFKSSSC